MQFLKHTESPARQQRSRCLAKERPPPSLSSSPWTLTPSLPPPAPPLIMPPSLHRPHYTQILTLLLPSAFLYNLSLTSLYTIICSFSLFFLYPPLPGRSSQSSLSLAGMPSAVSRASLLSFAATLSLSPPLPFTRASV